MQSIYHLYLDLTVRFVTIATSFSSNPSILQAGYVNKTFFILKSKQPSRKLVHSPWQPFALSQCTNRDCVTLLSVVCDLTKNLQTQNAYRRCSKASARCRNCRIFISSVPRTCHTLSTEHKLAFGQPVFVNRCQLVTVSNGLSASVLSPGVSAFCLSDRPPPPPLTGCAKISDLSQLYVSVFSA